jgi:hypothetical protein
MCGFECAQAFDSAHNCQYLGCSYFSNWTPADPGKDVAFEAPNNAVAVVRGPDREILRKPLPRHDLKTVCRTVCVGQLLSLAVFAGVDAIGQ